MSTITISRIEGSALYHRYPRQSEAQPCHVRLDARTGALRAEYNPEIGNARSFAEVQGHVLAWGIPALKASAANLLLEAIAKIAPRIRQGYSPSWDGHNIVAVYSLDAKEAIEEIEVICGVSGDAEDLLVVWEASEWFESLGSREQQAREIEITATTTDEELEEIGDREFESAQEVGVDNIEGLSLYLASLRDFLTKKGQEKAHEVHL